MCFSLQYSPKKYVSVSKQTTSDDKIVCQVWLEILVVINYDKLLGLLVAKKKWGDINL